MTPNRRKLCGRGTGSGGRCRRLASSACQPRRLAAEMLHQHPLPEGSRSVFTFKSSGAEYPLLTCFPSNVVMLLANKLRGFFFLHPPWTLQLTAAELVVRPFISEP